MKKILLALFFLALLFLLATYFLLPAQPSFAQTISINANPSVTTRILRDSDWKKWWPLKRSAGDSILEFNNYTFVITNKLYNGLEVRVSKKQNSFLTSVNIIPLSVDSVKLDWMGIGKASYSPFKRIQQYEAKREIQQSIQILLDSLKTYLQQPMNTYGLKIVEERVTDTLLITSKSEFKSYPSLTVIYEMIQALRDYIKKRDLKEVNYPMLHVLKLGKDEYSTMVAIPVNRETLAQNGIAYKRMAPGKILVTEVRGGPRTIQVAYAQYEEYLQDYHRISPALPFESLVTERIREPDTSKWVTRIYYPVF